MLILNFNLIELQATLKFFFCNQPYFSKFTLKFSSFAYAASIFNFKCQPFIHLFWFQFQFFFVSVPATLKVH